MKIIGIDTGASFTRIWDGEHEVRKLRTPRSYTQYLLLLSNLLKVYEPVRALAVALPALVENQQIIRRAKLGGDWEERNIESDIRRLVRVTGAITIKQDIEVAGYAVQFQELDDLEPTALITLSTGIAGTLITRDYLLPLEVGHMILNLSGGNIQCGCGQFGCVEADLSGTGIYKRLGIQPESIENPMFWSDYGVQLSRFLVVLSALFKLRQIILSGGVSQRYPLFLEQLCFHLEANLRLVAVPIVRPSRLGDKVGVYGAYWPASKSANKSLFG